MSEPFYDIATFGPRISLGYLLRRVNKLSTARVEAAFDGSDITFSQWVVLALVSTGTADTCSAVARDMGHDKGAMTRLVDQLEERGLIRRTRGESDRRVAHLAVTEAGYETTAQLAAGVMHVWNDILDGFDRDEIQQAISTLTRLLGRLETLEEKGVPA